MRKTLLVLAIVALSSVTAHAAFVNGGFESGDFTGWTKDGGYWGNSPTGDLGKSAIVTPGLDPLTNNHLNMVFNGSYAARVNNSDPNYHYSILKQTVEDWQDEHIYFAWAAVLEEPYHPPSDEPFFSLELTDLDTGSSLYSIAFNSGNAGSTGINWYTGAYNYWGEPWKYSDWNTVNLDTTNVKGHDLQLLLTASDCGWGGHGGYAYLDGFGAKPPVQNNVVPEPASLSLLGLGLIGLVFRKKK